MAKSIATRYLILCKPRVVLLMLVTAWVGMYFAYDSSMQPMSLLTATLGITFCSASAAILNHYLDRDIDKIMLRTKSRPLARQEIPTHHALLFASILGLVGILVLYYFTNPIATVLTFLALIGYAIIYTLFLKRATPQNIVLGGLSGAMPPLLGWSCLSGDVNPYSLLLVLIIFIWTPPHFWALAIARVEDYKKAAVPMLPVTHGINYTKLLTVLYSILLIPITLLPYITRMSGIFYAIISSGLGIWYLYYNVKLQFAAKQHENILAFKSFHFSIVYLFGIFLSLVLDTWIKRSIHGF